MKIRSAETGFFSVFGNEGEGIRGHPVVSSPGKRNKDGQYAGFRDLTGRRGIADACLYSLSYEKRRTASQRKPNESGKDERI